MTKNFKWDLTKHIIIPGSKEVTIAFCAKHFIESAKKAIKQHGCFFVALSGGSSPKSIYELLAKNYKNDLPWNLVYLFWSDERSVDPTSVDSNYLMAMSSGFSSLDIPSSHIFRMKAESEIEKEAALYEKSILTLLKDRGFDLVILGMGDDGHSASLFPDTKALDERDHLVTANYVPQKNTWRMTFTFKCINEASTIVFYVLGDAKKETLQKVFLEGNFPCMHIGTERSPALWIVDDEAASLLLNHLT